MNEININSNNYLKVQKRLGTKRILATVCKTQERKKCIESVQYSVGEVTMWKLDSKEGVDIDKGSSVMLCLCMISVICNWSAGVIQQCYIIFDFEVFFIGFSSIWNRKSKL